jgi:hypothetical protein
MLEWARLAAYIDGEGAILLNRFSEKSGPGKQFNMWLRVVLVNTDFRLPQWCQDIFGGVLTAEHRKENPNHRPVLRWHCSCKHAEWILKGCYQFFLIEREEADIALAFQRTLGGPGKRVSHETRQHREDLREKLHLLKRKSPLYKSPDEFPDSRLSNQAG